MSQKCVGCSLPHLQQLLGRVRRAGEGAGKIQTSQLSRLLGLGHLKHVALEALHSPLMKMRGTEFGAGGGGKHSSTEQVIWQKSLQAWIGFLENMKVCENKSSTFKPVLDLYKKMRTKKKKKMRTGVPSVGQVMCTHPCYIIPACLRCLCLENSISTSNTVKLIFK